MHGLEARCERQTLSGGEVNRDAGLVEENAELVEENYRRAGSYLTGRRMFDEGEVGWIERSVLAAAGV